MDDKRLDLFHDDKLLVELGMCFARFFVHIQDKPVSSGRLNVAAHSFKSCPMLRFSSRVRNLACVC